MRRNRRAIVRRDLPVGRSGDEAGPGGAEEAGPGGAEEAGPGGAEVAGPGGAEEAGPGDAHLRSNAALAAILRFAHEIFEIDGELTALEADRLVRGRAGGPPAQTEPLSVGDASSPLRETEAMLSRLDQAEREMARATGALRVRAERVADGRDRVDLSPHTRDLGSRIGKVGTRDRASSSHGDRDVSRGTAGSPPTRRSRRLQWVLSLAGIVAVAVAAVLLFSVSGFQLFEVPSGSMLPTLKIGDRILVEKAGLDRANLHPGAIVVFRRPPNDTVDTHIADVVKRIVAVPGQIVSSAAGHLFVNGIEDSEPYLARRTVTADVPRQRIPADHYFVMGDNRSDSYDSRYFGPVSASAIIGRVVAQVLPPGAFHTFPEAVGGATAPREPSVATEPVNLGIPPPPVTGRSIIVGDPIGTTPVARRFINLLLGAGP